jgi:hypothetical protein
MGRMPSTDILAMLDAQPLRKLDEMTTHSMMNMNFRIATIIPPSKIYLHSNSRQRLQENELLLIKKMGIHSNEEQRDIPLVILHTARPSCRPHNYIQYRIPNRVFLIRTYFYF